MTENTTTPTADDGGVNSLSNVAGTEIDHGDALTRSSAGDAADQEGAGSCSKYLLSAHTSRARSPSN